MNAGGAPDAGEGGAANQGGASGSGGEGGVAEPCSDEGAVECASAASTIVRTCTDGVWVDAVCKYGSLCDSSEPSCKPVIDDCLDRGAGDAFCEEDTRRVCGPDLVTTTDETCEGACLEGTCRKPACGDGKVQIGESCDDGNDEPGDGCTATCRAEPIAIDAGSNFACALLSDGRLKCWGANVRGQLGLNDVLARGDAANELGTNLPATLTDVTAFSVGGRHACAISKSEVWCWGDNLSGQLGSGTTTPPYSRAPVQIGVGKAIDITLGAEHACATLASGSVVCWGANSMDQLALGPTRVSAPYEPRVPGESPPQPVFMNPLSVQAGYTTTCAVYADALQCGGFLDPLPITGKTPFPLGSALAGVAIGDRHACVWTLGGIVNCWGDGGMGQFGIDRPLQRLEPDPTTFVPLPKPVTSVAAGLGSNCALLNSHQVVCWGSGPFGLLGRSDFGSQNPFLGDEPGEMAQLAPIDLGTNGAVQAITHGDDFACALLQRGVIKCWGANESGQLGQGTVENRGDNAGEMGDALAETVLD